MAKLNLSTKAAEIFTHEGGKAKVINPELQLRRSVMTCMLWENTFYEDGVEISDRIKELCNLVPPEKIADMVVEAREKMNLRHVPLLLARILARQGYKKLAGLLSRIIQRPDELTEFLAIYWKDGRQPLSAQVKKGLARAFIKFNSYQLAKYNRKEKIKLRDVLFLSHAKPQTEEQAGVWKRLIEGTLEPPDTWEVALSSGKNKKETWERLLKENKLGTLALLRNLRNMNEVSVDESLIKEALCGIKIERVLPFRFIAAAKYAPNLEPELERSMFKCLSEHEKLTGKTILLVDVSGSMMDKISRKSELSRLDAACGLAMLVREICENVEIITFSNQVIQCPPRCGFALRDVIIKSQIHAGTYMGSAVSTVNKEYSYDRIIVITDEQSHDNVPDPTGKGYVINVASNRNGVGYYKWLHIDGWSEAVISYIQEYERQAQDCLVKDG